MYDVRLRLSGSGEESIQVITSVIIIRHSKSLRLGMSANNSYGNLHDIKDCETGQTKYFAQNLSRTHSEKERKIKIILK
jgi:hypothetical protein